MKNYCWSQNNVVIYNYDFIELLTDVSIGTNAIIRRVAAKFNLTTSQVYHLLSIPFDGIPISGLAHRLGLDNSTLTRNIQKLEKSGLVMRMGDNYDKRIQQVVLTESGASLLRSLELRLEEQNGNIMEQIDLDTQEHVTTVLEKLSWALGCIRERT